MSGEINFYFDFTSPFSYLAHTQLPDIATKYGREIAYHVVDLAAIKLGGGNTGPTTREMPLKYRYSGADQRRWATRYGVTIKRPSGYGPNHLNKGAYFAQDQGVIGDYVAKAWGRLWGAGGDITDPALIRGVTDELGWDWEEFLTAAQSPETEARYRASTQAAHDRGVFGVPTMIIGNEMWWGNDRLDFMEEYLAQ